MENNAISRVARALGTVLRPAGTAALVVVLSACSKAPKEPVRMARDDAIPVTTAQVAEVPLDRALDVVGTLFAMNDAAIAAQVEGQIEKTLVDFGQHVVARQEMALIDTASYEALANQSAAAVTKAKANAVNAEQTLKRVIELQQSRISSASDLDSATATAEQARAEVKAAEAAEAVARLNLKRSHVVAPFDGTISERLANCGDYVKTGASLFRLVEDNELKYIVQVPEKHAAEIKPDQVIQLSVDAWPGEVFEGKVYLVSPSVNLATRAFNVGARIPNTQRKLKANSFARGILILRRAVPTPMVPIEAIVNFAGVTKVFVIKDGVAHGRDVSVGRIQDGRQEVVEGLQPGELVATTGTTKLFENAKVRLLPVETKAASR